MGFEERAAIQLGRPTVRAALPSATDASIAAARAVFGDCDKDALRDRGRDIRTEAVASLDVLLPAFIERCRANGITVHLAPDGVTACRLIAEIIEGRGATRVVKAKSMASEEIELNAALEARSIEVTETDLGERV